MSKVEPPPISDIVHSIENMNGATIQETLGGTLRIVEGLDAAGNKIREVFNDEGVLIQKTTVGVQNHQDAITALVGEYRNLEAAERKIAAANAKGDTVTASVWTDRRNEILATIESYG